MKVYYATLTDHLGNLVQDTKVFPSSRQAAAVAQNIIKSCGPAQGFVIRYVFISASQACKLMNTHEPQQQLAWS